MEKINTSDLNDLQITKLESELVLNCLDFEIMILNQDFKIIFANDAILNKLGLAKNNVFNNFCYKVTHGINEPCQPPSDPCPVVKALKTGQPAVELHTHKNKNGDKFFVNVTAAPINTIGKEQLFLHIALPAETGKKKEENVKLAMKKTIDVLQVVQLYQKQIAEIEEKTKNLEKTKKDLQGKISQLELFNKVTVGRELKMLELKKKIEDLEKNIK